MLSANVPCVSGKHCLAITFSSDITLGATIPQVRFPQSFVLELLLTALLMFVILGVSTGARRKGITAG